jgi:V8-like Glu-specific endopeptidase
MDPQHLDKTLWPQVALIRSYFSGLNGWFAVGSGTLIHPRAILTAAHVIYDSGTDRGGLSNRFEVYFGGGAFAPAPGKNGRVPDKWKSDTSSLSVFDIGVILLDNALGGVTPADWSQPTTISDILGHQTNVVGYPIDPQFYDNASSNARYAQLGGGYCTPIDMGSPWNNYRVAYSMVSLEGMSGGPVYRTDEARAFTIRAVNTALFNGTGNGVMLYPELYDQVVAWVKEVA